MNNKIKFSIIIPVYNSELYIGDCIRSIRNQTYNNWELILVDDGSSDNSASIIKQFSIIDDRILYLYQENQGAGKARNHGLERATGDYVYFIDSDDHIDKDLLLLINNKSNDCDVVFLDVARETPEGKIIEYKKMSSYKKWSKDRLLRSQMTGKVEWGGFFKCVKNNLLKANNIKYQTTKVGEENLYSFQVLYYAKDYCFIDDKILYYYVDRAGSLSKSKDLNPYYGVANNLQLFLLTEGLYPQYANTLNSFKLTALIIHIKKITNYVKDKKDRKCQYQKAIDTFNAYYDFSYLYDSQNIEIKARIFLPFLKIKTILPIIICSKLRFLLKSR